MTRAKQEHTATVELARDLIRRRSITPADAGCQDFLAGELSKLGFEVENFPFGEVKNLWARRGKQSPLFVFAGHTDVVPPGPENNWSHPPFNATVDDKGMLYGRGAADMKSAIAAMVIAVNRFLAANEPKGSIAFLLTSDEEGVARDGTRRVVETLEKRREKIDFCIVGESTSDATVGDTMKNGRRGSLGAKLTVRGIQGHVAYPERARNPIHQAVAAIDEMCRRKWDDGNEFFTPTTMQFSNINAGTGADNVIPAALEAVFNFRFSSAVTEDHLRNEVESIFNKHGLEYEIEWRLSGLPFLTQPGTLTDAVRESVREVMEIECQFSTTGGTSDARFIAPTGAQVIELGLLNATIHKIDEHVAIADIDKLALIYERVLEKLLL